MLKHQGCHVFSKMYKELKQSHLKLSAPRLIVSIHWGFVNGIDVPHRLPRQAIFAFFLRYTGRGRPFASDARGDLDCKSTFAFPACLREERGAGHSHRRGLELTQRGLMGRELLAAGLPNNCKIVGKTQRRRIWSAPRPNPSWNRRALTRIRGHVSALVPEFILSFPQIYPPLLGSALGEKNRAGLAPCPDEVCGEFGFRRAAIRQPPISAEALLRPEGRYRGAPARNHPLEQRHC